MWYAQTLCNEGYNTVAEYDTLPELLYDVKEWIKFDKSCWEWKPNQYFVDADPADWDEDDMDLMWAVADRNWTIIHMECDMETADRISDEQIMKVNLDEWFE